MRHESWMKKFDAKSLKEMCLSEDMTDDKWEYLAHTFNSHESLESGVQLAFTYFDRGLDYQKWDEIEYGRNQMKQRSNWMLLDQEALYQRVDKIREK